MFKNLSRMNNLMGEFSKHEDSNEVSCAFEDSFQLKVSCGLLILEPQQTRLLLFLRSTIIFNC